MKAINRVLIRAARHEAAGRIDLSRRRAWFDETPPSGGSAVKPPDGTAPSGGTASDDALPDWVNDPKRAYEAVQEARREAAKYRTEKNAAETKLNQKLTAEQQAEQDRLAEQNEFKTLWEQEKTKREAAEAASQKAALDALRVTVGTAYGLPVELAARLVGATEDELKADAEKLKGFVVPSDGKTPQGERRQTTSPIPDGGLAKETDDQRRRRLRGGGPDRVLSGGSVQVVKRPE